MARSKSEFLKAMGKGWEIWLALVNEVLSLGGDDQHVASILTDKDLRRKLAEMIVGASKSFADLLTACGQDFVESDFTEENFPLVDDGTADLPVEEYCFDKELEDGAVIGALRRRGFEPVGVKRAMEWIAANTDAQLKHPIAVIGVKWKRPHSSYVHYPVFYFNNYDRQKPRSIGLECLRGIKLQRDMHFLVVRT